MIMMNLRLSWTCKKGRISFIVKFRLNKKKLFKYYYAEKFWEFISLRFWWEREREKDS